MNWRMVVTLSLFFLAIVVIVSGVALYVGPPGSLKQAALLGLTRSQWSDLHAVSALAMAGLVLFHVWFNRRALVTYLRGAKAYEAILTAIIVLVFALTPLLNVPPGSWIVQVSENLEASWAQHYELKGFGFMTLSEFCQQYGVPLQKAMSYLKSLGLEVSPNSYLRDLADELGTSPAALAEELLKLKEQGVQQAVQQAAPQQAEQRPVQPGQGFGTMTLQQFCQENGIPLEKAISYIEQKYGVRVTPDMTIRDIAFSVGLKPYQLVQELNNLR